MGSDLILFTITFDPTHDTPEVMEKYGKAWNADVEGRTNREIAELLHVSVNTVLSHRGRIMKTLRVNKTAESVTLAVRMGLASVI
jgi:two-component system nitrate/nitrite response regulator NarL